MLRSVITCEMVVVGPNCPKCIYTMSNEWLISVHFEFDQMAGKWQETIICITTVQIARKAKSENMRLYSCKLTALELKMLPAVNGVQFMRLLIQR